MSKTKLSKKQVNSSLQKENSKEKFYYALFIGCIIAFVIAYWLEPITIGNDVRYTLFVVLFPILIGVTLFITYRKKILNTDAVAAVKNKWQKLGYAIVLLGCAALFSYLTLGLVTEMVWRSANHYTAKNQRQHIVILPVNEFHEASGGRHSSNSIYFNFQGNKESIKVSKDFIKQYKTRSNTKRHIQLILRKGIWNHYFVDDWQIIK